VAIIAAVLAFAGLLVIFLFLGSRPTGTVGSIGVWALIGVLPVAALAYTASRLWTGPSEGTPLPTRIWLRRRGPEGYDYPDMDQLDPSTSRTIERLEAERRHGVPRPDVTTSEAAMARAMTARGVHWDVPAGSQPIVCPECSNVNAVGAPRCGRCDAPLSSRTDARERP